MSTWLGPNPTITLTSGGSGYCNATVIGTPGISVGAAFGEIKYNEQFKCFELYDGSRWHPISALPTTVKNYIEQIKIAVIDHINKEHTDNITITDALDTWSKACDQLQVIIALAGKNK